MHVRALLRHALLALSLLLSLGVTAEALAQDLSSFLSHPPSPGSWARYRLETRNPQDPQAPPKVKNFSLAVTGSEVRDGRAFLWLEVSPMNLAGDRDGTLRLLIPASPTREEALNPFREVQAAEFLPREGEAYALTSSVVGLVRSQARGAKVGQTQRALSTEPRALGSSSPVPCEKAHVRTTSEGDLFFRRRTLVEEGTYWFSEQTPFRLVDADLTRTETKDGGTPRIRTVTVRLQEAGRSGAKSALPAPPTQTRGLLSLLFH